MTAPYYAICTYSMMNVKEPAVVASTVLVMLQKIVLAAEVY
jgi:hypothetical protein